MDAKVVYLAKTLSRTKRKDYENYVVNAIWNRVNNYRLFPVTQQYVTDGKGNRYFIDLYFPQLKIGIECDEGYHSSKAQITLDAEREMTISDVLDQIDGGEYLALHIDVTQPWELVESQINDHVATIKAKIDEIGIENAWLQFEPDLEEYFENRTYITVSDNVLFPSNKEVYNIILGQNYSYHQMHGGERFKKLYTEYGYEQGMFPWFPQLTIKKPTSKGYYNLFSKDGKEICEYINDPHQNMQRKQEGRYIGKKRVVFSQIKDSMKDKSGYRFIGVFIGDHYDENGIITYKLIDDKFKIVKKQ